MSDRRHIDQLTDGESVEETYLVTDKRLRANRNGNLYLQFEVRDRTGSMGARVWNAAEAMAKTFDSGDFLDVKGKVQLHQGSLQLIVSQAERVPAERVRLADFLPHSKRDTSELWNRLRSVLLRLENPHLRALCECYLMDEEFARGFSLAPAGVRVHHAYVSGLLEHALTMMDVADRVAPLYPGLDRDLLIVGIFLHDSGKVRELVYNRAFGYSDEGQLVGHIAIGCEMLEDKVRQVPELTEEEFPRELHLRLKHMILSHHGSLEFGSPKLPMTPEAAALHAIDNLDTRVHIVLREIEDDRAPESAWTAYNHAMGRRLFKGGGGAGDSFDGSAAEGD